MLINVINVKFSSPVVVGCAVRLGSLSCSSSCRNIPFFCPGVGRTELGEEQRQIVTNFLMGKILSVAVD